MIKKTVIYNLFILSLVWFILLSSSSAKVSVNVPLGHWSYEAIDKLYSLGLVTSIIYSSKPFTRMEMARLTREASEKVRRLQEGLSQNARLRIAKAVLQRLQKEFAPEIRQLDGENPPTAYIKPLEDFYFTYYYGDDDFYFEYDKGRNYSEGSDLKTGFSSRGMFFDHIAFYLNPEFRYGADQQGNRESVLRLLEGYVKLEWHNIELETGRDSLWWGSGRHGSLILTDNAKPFDLIKLSNPTPTVLPWLFRYLGLFNFNIFWTRLESDRYIPNPELMGMRVNFKPFPFLELGASRTVMLGGEGDQAPKSFSELSFTDWLKVLSGKNLSGDLNANQIAGFDALLHFGSADRFLRFIKSLDLWGELYGEDEAGGLPSKNGFMAGIRLGDLLLRGTTDLMIEYADNVISGYPYLWYSHSVYKTGYRYEGKIMGHEMGSDARDLFIALTHYLTPSLIVNLQYDHQERGVESSNPQSLNRYDTGLTWYRSEATFIQVGWRLEDFTDADQTTNIIWIGFNHSL